MSLVSRLSLYVTSGRFHVRFYGERVKSCAERIVRIRDYFAAIPKSCANRVTLDCNRYA